MDSSESSGSNEGEQLDEPEEQVDDMSIFIEALLQKLEQVAEWPSKVEDLKQFIQTALPKVAIFFLIFFPYLFSYFHRFNP